MRQYSAGMEIQLHDENKLLYPLPGLPASHFTCFFLLTGFDFLIEFPMIPFIISLADFSGPLGQSGLSD